MGLWRFLPGLSSPMIRSISSSKSNFGDSLGSLSVALGLVSLHALGLVLARLNQRLPSAPQRKSSLPDDVLYEIFSYLDPADAAQAGLVCTHWHQNSAHASYREVTIHTSSPFSRSLALTLLHNPDLRRHVRHLTVVHCSWYPLDYLYQWVHLLPPNSLHTLRIFGVSNGARSLLDTLGTRSARTEVAYFGYLYPDDFVRRSIAEADDPARRRWLQEGLSADWLLDTEVGRYRDDIAAVSLQRPFTDAIEQFSEGIQLHFCRPASARVSVCLTKGNAGDPPSREDVDALLDVLGKYITEATCIVVTLVYSALDLDRENVEDLVQSVGCLCAPESVAGDTGFPPGSVMTAGLGATSTRLTRPAAKAIVDRVWRDVMWGDEGPPVQCVSLHITYDGSIDGLAEPCAACGLTWLRTYYLPR